MSHYNLKFPSLRILKNPHAREANYAEAYNAPFMVIGPQSPSSWLKAIEEIGSYFKRELKFEFPPYSANERFKQETQRDRILVFYNTEILDHKPTLKNPKDFKNAYIFFGAICVRCRDWKVTPLSWNVTWVWLHPYERRHGHLTKAWPFLLKMFPNPSVEPPFSPAMSAFLKKVGYADVRGQ